MFTKQQKTDNQTEILETTLRAMIDFTRICDPQSSHLVARRPFTIHTREGAWSGALLPDLIGAIAVQSDLNHDIIAANTRVGRDLSWALRSVGIYACQWQSISEFESRLRDHQEHAELWTRNNREYQPTQILELFRALGAADQKFLCGHFTWPEAISGVSGPQVLALSGTVARTQWRAFLLPTIKPLQFADGGEIS